MSDDKSIKVLLRRCFQDPQLHLEISHCRGGETHRCYRIDFANPVDGHHSLFVKLNELRFRSVLESEYTSLCILATDNQLSYPKPLLFDSDEKLCYLVMRYHNLSGLSDTAAAQLGTMLARQHRVSAGTFGWEQDNYIGSTAQKNDRYTNWQEFYRDQRLLPQLALAKANNLDTNLIRQLELLVGSLDAYFIDYQPLASLLHGDLWSGNAAFDLDSATALLFDPAPYYGDRETDIAMTELFGGFSASFYRAYQQAWPLHTGYPTRKPLYNLYHALNHFNLFGDGYASMVRTLVSELNNAKSQER